MADQLFTQSEQPSGQPQQPQTTPQTNPFSDQLKMILNETGEQKYKSVEDALKALMHSQQYIPTLKHESESKDAKIAALEAELASRKTAEQLLSEHAVKPTLPETPPVQGLSEQPVDIENLVIQALTRQQQATQAQQNEDAVQSVLRETFGETAKTVVAQKAAELGMTVEQLGALSRTSPKAVLSFFNVQQSTKPNLNSSSINTLTLKPQQPDELARPQKSLLSGARNKEVIEYMRQVRDHVYKKYDVQV